jgi:hypothetical protein
MAKGFPLQYLSFIKKVWPTRPNDAPQKGSHLAHQVCIKGPVARPARNRSAPTVAKLTNPFTFRPISLYYSYAYDSNVAVYNASGLDPIS